MVQVQRTETPVNMKKTKNGKIQKKNSETFTGIPIEKKNYKINQLSALEGKFKKIDTELCVDDEKHDGRSIMVNMKTSTYEIVKKRVSGSF